MPEHSPSRLLRSLSLLPMSLVFAALAVGCAASPPDAGSRADPRESTGPAADPPDLTSALDTFATEVEDLRLALGVPGLAYVVVSDGAVIATDELGDLTAETPLRIASVTKALSAVLALQLVEEGALDLDASAKAVVPVLDLPDEVSVRNLLNHSSEGVVGEEYVYGTNRFAMVARVIESVAGEDFGDALRNGVLAPSDMSVHESPHLGSHAGLVSTVNSMGRFLAALDAGMLLSEDSMDVLATPSRATTGPRRGESLPTSLGFFVQTVQGLKVHWSFGQDDPDHSGALLVRLPDQKLSLFLLANSNVVSDPFRLLMGDVTKSPFAMSFLRLMTFIGPDGEPLGRPERDADNLREELAKLESASGYDFADELVGWAMIDLWNRDAPGTREKIGLAASRVGLADPSSPVDAVSHFAVMQLPDAEGEDAEFKDAGIAMGRRLLERHPRNRWVLMAQGYLCMERGHTEEGKERFRQILDLPNQEPDFLNRLFHAWAWMALAQMSADDAPDEARVYLQKILDNGMNGPMLDEARTMLETLDGIDGA